MNESRQSNLFPYLSLFFLLLGTAFTTSCGIIKGQSITTQNTTIPDGEKRLDPGAYQALIIPNREKGHKNYRLTGLLKSQNGPTKVLLLDETNFRLWKTRQPHQIAYMMTEVLDEKFDTPIDDKPYYLIGQNASKDSPVVFQHYDVRIKYDVSN